MSRRPRLVEEGKPIGDQTTTNQESSTDEFLESEYQKAVRKEEERHDPHGSRIGSSTWRFQHEHPHRHDYIGDSMVHDHAMAVDHDHDGIRPFSSLGRAAAHLSVQERPRSHVHGQRHVLQTKFEIGRENTHEEPRSSFDCHVGQGQHSIPRRKLVTKFEIVESSRDNQRKYSDDSSTGMMDVDHAEHGFVSSSSIQPLVNNVLQHPYVENNDLYDDPSERMEIDDTHLQRLPLVVLDGANIAYAYSQATETTSTSNGSYLSSSSKNGLIPNVLGIQIAVSYFLHGGCRVQVVVPVYWMRRKPTSKNNGGISGDNRSSSSKYNSSVISSQLDILNRLKEQNILCCSPPTDDDDAYCISIARRIDARFEARKKTSSSLQSYATSHFANFGDDLTSIGGAYILSNDLFRDAKDRDLSGDLTRWLDGDDNDELLHCLPRRISYSFANLGSMNKYGDAQLDFVPNPRHPLIAMIERSHRTNGTTY